MVLNLLVVWFGLNCDSDCLNEGLSKHQEMGFTPVRKVLQSNDDT